MGCKLLLSWSSKHPDHPDFDKATIVRGIEKMAANENKKERRTFGDWLFFNDPSGIQILFDVSFGVILPIVCLVCDPIVFKRSEILIFNARYIPPVIFPRCAPFAYCLIGIDAALLLFVFFLHLRSAFLGGCLLSGALFSLVLGLLMTPVTLLGMMIGIGFLGLTPFFTSFVYFRNFLRIIRHSIHRSAVVIVFLTFLGLSTAFLISFTFHKIVSMHIDASLESIACGNAHLETQARETLQRLRFLFNDNRLIILYNQTPDENQKKKISEVYQQITGQTIEKKLARIND
jgi:hypothetical protein